MVRVPDPAVPDPSAPAVEPAPGVASEALEALDAASRAIAAVGPLEPVLQTIVDRVAELVGARYAALGIVDRLGRIERFITTGISPAERAAIGPLPHGRGLLGLIIREQRSIRTADIADHPASIGFPPNHPPMRSFLGVPVTSGGRAIGNLYLTDKVGAASFSPADERLTELFAAHAAIAIDNARLHDRVSRLAVIEERERISRDLHDGVIQGLYAIALSLEDVPDLMVHAPAEIPGRIDRAIDALNVAIRDIRNFILGLQPELLAGTDLIASIEALADEVRMNGLVVQTRLDPSVGIGLSEAVGLDLVQVAREALSNVGRHARARRASISLWREGPIVRMEVADDGIGFDADVPLAAEHRGLSNMHARVAAHDGQLTVDTRPGGGTTVRIRVPDDGTDLTMEETAR